MACRDLTFAVEKEVETKTLTFDMVMILCPLINANCLALCLDAP